jgi:hypothetical protein
MGVTPPVRRITWTPCWRIIPSRFAPIQLFERVADPGDFEAVFAVEALTNPRLRDEVGDIRLTFAVRRTDVATRPLEPKAQPIFPIQPVNPLVVHHPSLPAQQNIDPVIAIARAHRRKIADAPHQRRLVGSVRHVAHRRPVDAERKATAPLADRVGRLDVRDELAPPPRRQSFFASTSCKMCLSRLRSATSCFNLRF